MNSSKGAAKGQKKLQKTNKKQHQKQQQQQQQPQQQQQQNGISKPATNAKVKPNDTNPNNHTNNNNNNNTMVQNNNSQSTIGAGGTAAPATTNITQKFKEQYEMERRSQMPSVPSNENLPIMERTRSFRGKLSKLFNHLTSSKENLTRTDESKDETGKTPFTFTRSRSMILLRRPNRRSFIEPQLEQLSEEAEKSGDPMSPASPRKNSLANNDNALDAYSPILRRRADTVSSVKTPPRRQSTQALTSTPLDESPEMSMQRKPSTTSLAPNPQQNFQKRRSNTLIASFKSSWAGLGIGAAVGICCKDANRPETVNATHQRNHIKYINYQAHVITCRCTLAKMYMYLNQKQS